MDALERPDEPDLHEHLPLVPDAHPIQARRKRIAPLWETPYYVPVQRVRPYFIKGAWLVSGGRWRAAEEFKEAVFEDATIQIRKILHPGHIDPKYFMQLLKVWPFLRMQLLNRSNQLQMMTVFLIKSVIAL